MAVGLPDGAGVEREEGSRTGHGHFLLESTNFAHPTPDYGGKTVSASIDSCFRVGNDAAGISKRSAYPLSIYRQVKSPCDGLEVECTLINMYTCRHVYKLT